MKSTHLALILLLSAGICLGRPLYVLAGEPIVQEDYRDVCPIHVDPNQDDEYDHLLSAVPHDPNAWLVMYGAYDRPLLTYHPNGFPISVILQSSKNNRGRLQTDANGVTHLLADLPPGERFWAFIRLEDSPPPPLEPKVKVFLIIFDVLAEHQAPILARLHYIQRKFMEACKTYGWNGADRQGPAAKAWLADWRG